MDWNKTKTIFIVVFAVLNIFLWSLYINQQEQVKNVEVLGQPSIEESLKLDNITYDELSKEDVYSSYVSAETGSFQRSMFQKKEKQDVSIIEGTTVYSNLEKPFRLNGKKDKIAYSEFLDKYIVFGEQYRLWEVHEDEGYAVFFQEVYDEPIYFSPNASLEVYFNEDGEIYRYKQRRLEAFVSFNQKKNLLTPFDVVSTLASKGHLEQNAHIDHVELGYSTLVQFTDTQVFAPTWHVKVTQKDKEVEHFFVNAIEGKVVELQEDH